MQKLIRQVDEKKGIVQVTVGDERWYFKEGKDPETKNPIMLAVPSVTWIAGHYPKGLQFYRWLAEKGWDEAESIKVAAGDKGSKVHAAISAIFRGEEVRIDSKYANNSKSTAEETVLEELTFEEIQCIQSFLAWRNGLKSFKPLAWDITVFSEIENYAGTIDLIAEVDGEIYIIDFKTSQYVWTEYELQVSAYRHAVENGENVIYEMNPNGTTKDPIKVANLKTAILQIGYKKNKAGFKFTELENQFEMFKIARAIWNRESASQTPKKVEYPIVLSPAIKFDAPLGKQTTTAEPVTQGVAKPKVKSKKKDDDF